jgi:hypothetical protein
MRGVSIEGPSVRDRVNDDRALSAATVRLPAAAKATKQQT